MSLVLGGSGLRTNNINPTTGTATIFGSIILNGTLNSTGSASIDFSSSSGTFRTPTGTATFSGPIGIAPGSASIDFSSSSGTFRTPTGTATFSGPIGIALGSASINFSSSSGTFRTPTGTATFSGHIGIAPGSASIDFSSSSGTFQTPTGLTTLSGSVTIAPGSASINFSSSSGTFQTPTGLTTLSGPVAIAPGSASINFSSSSGTFRTPTGTATFLGSAVFNGPVGVTGANVINITPSTGGVFNFRNTYCCKFIKNGVQSIPSNGVFVTVTGFTGSATGTYDTSPLKNMGSSGDRIIIRKSGLYMITAYGFSGSPPGYNLSWKLTLNGFTGTNVIMGQLITGNNTDDAYLNINQIINLTENNFIGVIVRTTSSGINVGGTTQATQLFLSATYLGDT